eukprot:6481133-Amphidinium_carterae.2
MGIDRSVRNRDKQRQLRRGLAQPDASVSSGHYANENESQSLLDMPRLEKGLFEAAAGLIRGGACSAILEDPENIRNQHAQHDILAWLDTMVAHMEHGEERVLSAGKLARACLSCGGRQNEISQKEYYQWAMHWALWQFGKLKVNHVQSLQLGVPTESHLGRNHVDWFFGSFSILDPRSLKLEPIRFSDHY